MPVLHVRCSKCRQLIPTGYDVDYDTFRSFTETERTLECPLCEETQVWHLDDVDRSVFKRPAK
jgi:hypothetical protein